MSDERTPIQIVAAVKADHTQLIPGGNLSVLADNCRYYIEQGNTAAALAILDDLRANGMRAVCKAPVAAIRPEE
jgi:hypothetical protein